MGSSLEQKILAAEQSQAFYHDEFVTDQVADYAKLVSEDARQGVLLDMGGGCGFFAQAVRETLGQSVRVLDADPESVARCGQIGIPATLGDALKPDDAPDVSLVSFNLMLHHLVGRDAQATRALQSAALACWRGKPVKLFVNEYIYQSMLGHVSGLLIFLITSSRILSAIGTMIARIIPAFRANTFGVGVRFRAHEEWVDLFRQAGFRVVGTTIGQSEPVALPLRLLLIKTIRRDSFLLEPALQTR
jgi:hypothetical protein